MQQNFEAVPGLIFFICEKWTSFWFGFTLRGDFSYSIFLAVAFPAVWKVN